MKAAPPTLDECPAYRLLGTAYHEAAHAVASYAAWPPTPIESASIVPNEESRGRVVRGERDDDWRDDVEDETTAAAVLAASEAMFFFAGYVAGALFRGDNAGLPIGVRATTDYGGAVDSASPTWDGDTDETLHVYAHAEPTRRLLQQPEIWLAVSRTASALLRRQTLSGDEIEAIVEEAGVEPDRYREPLFCEDEFDDEAFSWSRW